MKRKMNGRAASAPSNGHDQSNDVSPRQKAALLILFVTFCIDILGFGLVLTLVPYYVHAYPMLFGYRIPVGIAVGALTACYPILQLVFSPIWGRLSDRVGRRPIILMSLLGNSMAWLLFGVAHSLAVLFLARMLSGVLSSASLPTVQAYIADSTPPEKRSVWIGIVVGMGFSFGFMIGPPLGGLLGTSPWPDWMNAMARMLPGGGAMVAANHLAYPAFLAAAIAFTNFLVACRRLPESLSAEMRDLAASHRIPNGLGQLRHALSLPGLGPMLVILGLGTFAMQSLEQNVTLFGISDVSVTSTLNSWGQLTSAFQKGHSVYEIEYSPSDTPPAGWAASRTIRSVTADPSLPADQIRIHRKLVQQDTGLVLFMVALVVGMVQGGALKRLVPHFGEARLVLIGCLIATVGFFLVGQTRTMWPLVGASSIIGVGLSLIQPCLRGLISQESADHTQGSVLGVSESVRGLAMATGPLIGGWLFDLGHTLPFILGGVCMALSSIVALQSRSGVASAKASRA
jgi:MFS family permease